MVTKDIFSTIVQRNKEILAKKNDISNDILDHRNLMSKHTSNFNSIKEKNKKVHQERINKINNTLHQ